MMRKSATALASLAICAGLLAGCTPASSGITVTGTVDDATVAVAVPAIAGPAAVSAASVLGLGSVVSVTSVSVRVGDEVAAGQVIAVVDADPLQAQLAAAQADEAAASAQVQVLASSIDATYDKAADIADAKKKINKAIKELKKTRAKLVKAQKQAKKARTQLAKQLQQAQALLDNYPPSPPPGTPTQAELQAAIKQLKAAIKKVDAGLKTIKKALPKLDKGLATAKKGLKDLNKASTKLTDARATLKDAKEVAEIAAGASSIPVEMVQAQLAVGEVAAPVSGVVVFAAKVGDRLAPGASLVTIREQQPSTVTAWLSPAQAARVCVGDAAQITGDWMLPGSTVGAKLTRFAESYAYPPTDVPTDEIHLTTALEVEFTADAQLPAGVPVDISLPGCRPAADPIQTNG
ncbi:MAG: HlyD family efflux transporter periplasmic adaptor subunit [Propionibacteriaceae bacterium]|jgi:multidrug resistance efflux pump|nr:HlyD family efflux transporter periplasmic adaptor subunit [Propionibacteriaceae bacterium]